MDQPTPVHTAVQWRVPLMVLMVDEERREDPQLLDRLERVLESLPEGVEAVAAPERSHDVLSIGPRSGLTRAEDAVLALLPSGMTNAEIAERLFVSVNTVKTHLRRVFAKLGVRNRREAVRRAVEMGLVEFGSPESVWARTEPTPIARTVDVRAGDARAADLRDQDPRRDQPPLRAADPYQYRG